MAEEIKKRTTRRARAKEEEPSKPAAEKESVKKENAQEIEQSKVESKDAEVEALKALVSQLQEQIANQHPTQVFHVSPDSERVVMRFQADVAEDNVTLFGPEGMYGQVTGKAGTVTVPKAEWSRFFNESVRNMIHRRWLVVLSGMDDKERKIYGCDYKKGEVLDEEAFYSVLDMGDELLEIFPLLCRTHKEMVASKFLDAWLAGDRRAMNRDFIVALNDLSKADYKDEPNTDLRKRGLFIPIIEGMNEKDAN